MNRRAEERARPAIAALLCFQLLLPVLPRPAEAQKSKPEVVTLTIGQPSIWSLGQAHYFLARMHEKNRALASRFPNEDALDPNRPDASRLELVRSLFGIQAQFDQALGAENQIALDQFRDRQAQRDGDRVALETRRADLQRAESELLTLEEQVAALNIQDQLADAARGQAPPTAADVERKSRLAALKARRDAKKAERDRIATEVTNLTTRVNADIPAPDLSTTIPSGLPTDLPTSEAFTGFVNKALGDLTTPRFSASMALDNFVGMQYEIISKQLSLLRDEVGPDERVIFLELPASIYTVDKKANGYIAQVTWSVTGVYDQIPDQERQAEVICQNLRNEGKTTDDIVEELSLVEDLYVRKEWKGECLSKMALKEWSQDSDEEDARRPYPITLDMVKKDSSGPVKGRVRALELIPRQSALNVNENHGEVRGLFARGMLGLLNGLGLNLTFRNQKEMFERFLQQEVFASAYGKGMDKFGWTFGPLPGSPRIAPGQRTTYAVLAVPRNALALKLEASGKYFRRDKSPDSTQPSTLEAFDVLIPGEKTERFWVESISYTPVRKGQRVTALLRGSNFSPQLGVLVNGSPLRPSISLAQVGGTPLSASENGFASPGEFEITNSRELALSFSLEKDFAGTPIITLITPERSTDINSFKMEINFHGKPESLRNASLREPMFVEDLSLKSELQPMKLEELPKNRGDAAGCSPGPALGFELRRLVGTGLLPRAAITVHEAALSTVSLTKFREEVCKGKQRPLATQLSTHAYALYYETPRDKQRWKVRYEQPTRQGLEDREFVHVQPPGVSFAQEIRHYNRGPQRGPAEVHLTFTSPKAVERVELVDPKRPGDCREIQPGGADRFRVKCEVARTPEGSEREFITLKVVTEGGRETFTDVRLPVRPKVTSLRNAGTGKASGFADEAPVVFIEGAHLQNVTVVFFGDQEARLTTPPDSEFLSVKAPKVELAKGEQATVPVLFQTGSGERIATGLSFTYLGAPLPKVVAWPYPEPSKSP